MFVDDFFLREPLVVPFLEGKSYLVEWSERSLVMCNSACSWCLTRVCYDTWELYCWTRLSLRWMVVSLSSVSFERYW